MMEIGHSTTYVCVVWVPSAASSALLEVKLMHRQTNSSDVESGPNLRNLLIIYIIIKPKQESGPNLRNPLLFAHFHPHAVVKNE